MAKIPSPLDDPTGDGPSRRDASGAADALEGATDTPAVGSMMGSYRLAALLGRGGVGEVYRAEHMVLHRMVALKLLSARYARNAEMLQRFFKEAQAVNRIRHPNIVEITDLASTGTSAYFIMELLEGETLQLRLQRQGPLSVRDLLLVANQIVDALRAMHGAGIIHRDLKPDNIFLAVDLEGRERVKLLDFGLVKLKEGGLGDSDPSTMLGTPEYMSPETIRGQVRVDERSDLYSLGVTLYEALTGRKPIEARHQGELLIKVLKQTPSPPSKVLGRSVPKRLEALIMGCLEKDPARRPSASQLLVEVGALLEEERAAELRPPAAEPAAPPASRQRWQLAAVLLGLLGAAVTVYVLVRHL